MFKQIILNIWLEVNIKKLEFSYGLFSVKEKRNIRIQKGLNQSIISAKSQKRIIINSKKGCGSLPFAVFLWHFKTIYSKSYGKIYVVEIVDSKKSSYGAFRSFSDYVSIASLFY